MTMRSGSTCSFNMMSVVELIVECANTASRQLDEGLLAASEHGDRCPARRARWTQRPRERRWPGLRRVDDERGGLSTPEALTTSKEWVCRSCRTCNRAAPRRVGYVSTSRKKGVRSK